MSVVLGWLAVVTAVVISVKVGPVIERRARAEEARWLHEDLQALGRCARRAAQFQPAPRVNEGPGQTTRPVHWSGASRT